MISSTVHGNWLISDANRAFILQPWYIVRATICGILNSRQRQIIAFQNVQIDALLKKLGRKRLLLDDDQRRLLAVKGQAIGRKCPA